LSPLVGAALAINSVNLGEKWPLLITIGVILSALLYMDLLIRRQRSLTRKAPSSPKSCTSSALRSRGSGVIEDRDLSVDIFDKIR